MKFRTICYLVAALAVLVMAGVHFKPKPPGGAVVEPVKTVPVAAAEGAGSGAADDAVVPVVTRLPGPLPEGARNDARALALALPGEDARVELALVDGVWNIASLYATPADSARVERLLDSLYTTRYEPASDAVAANPAEIGLGQGQGIEVRLDGKALLTIGHGIGEFAETYVRDAESGTIHVAGTDFRGDVGIWDNDDSSLPGDSFWLAPDLLGLDVSRLTEVDFGGPGKNVTFVRDEQGVWRLAHNGFDANNGQFDPARLEEWLEDLARFAVLGAADPDRYVDLGMAQPSYRLRFIDVDGEMASAASVRGTDGRHYTELSTQPGIPYILPEWRFDLYFRRLMDVFPGVQPGFSVTDARFADLRRDGASVKFMRAGSGWRAVRTPFALRGDAFERWLAALANWRPRDFADVAAVPRNAPTVEISLDGDVRQYRLGGDLAGFNLVAVATESGNAFAVAPEEAAAMFPTFDQLFDVDPAAYLAWLGQEEPSAPVADAPAASDAVSGSHDGLPPAATESESEPEPAAETVADEEEVPVEEPVVDVISAPEEPAAEPQPEEEVAVEPLFPGVVARAVVGLEMEWTDPDGTDRYSSLMPYNERPGEWVLINGARGPFPAGNDNHILNLATSLLAWTGERIAEADSVFTDDAIARRLTVTLRSGRQISVDILKADERSYQCRDGDGRIVAVDYVTVLSFATHDLWVSPYLTGALAEETFDAVAVEAVSGPEPLDEEPLETDDSDAPEGVDGALLDDMVD